MDLSDENYEDGQIVEDEVQIIEQEQQQAQSADGGNQANDNQYGLYEQQYEDSRKKNRSAAYWCLYKQIQGDDQNRERLYCIICIQNQPDSNNFNKNSKGCFLYSSKEGNNNLKRHAEQHHSKVLLHINNYIKSKYPKVKNKRQRDNDKYTQGIYKFFKQNSYSQDHPIQRKFDQNLCIFFGKTVIPPSIVDNKFFQNVLYNLDPRINVPSRKKLCNQMLPEFSQEIQKNTIQPQIDQSLGGALTFDLWTSRHTSDVFSIIYHFIDNEWVMKRFHLELLEVKSTTGQELANQLSIILENNQLLQKIIAYVKDEGANLNTCTYELENIVSNDLFGEPFSGNCYAHAISKAASYAFKVQSEELKQSQNTMNKCITWTKKSGKGAGLLENAQQHAGIPVKKIITQVKTRFASTILYFKCLLDNKSAINYLYSELAPRGLHSRKPSMDAWEVIEVVYLTTKDTLSQVILQQSRDFWLIGDALNSIISLYLNFQNRSEILNQKFSEIKTNEDEQEENDLISILENLELKIREEVVNVLKDFLSPLVTYIPKQAHCMLSLMLDPRFKNLNIIRQLNSINSSDNSIQEMKQTIQQYDELQLLPLLNNIYCKNHPQANLDEVTNSVDLFNICDNSDFTIGSYSIIKSELTQFRKQNLENNILENPLNWWKNHEQQYPTISTAAKLILAIPGSQIENERTFSICGILTQLRRNRMGIKLMNNLVQIMKNFETNPSFQNFVSIQQFQTSEEQFLNELVEEEGGQDYVEE